MDKHGGPAFPTTYIGEQYRDGMPHPVALTEGGMSLRDYFAAHSLAGYRASKYCLAERDILANWAYEDADAMLKAREGSK
jgi:hypothetical protein